MLYILITCFLSSILFTPIVRKIAFKIGATDQPNYRKVHKKIMPRLGGLAIYISFILGTILFKPYNPSSKYILLGSIIIVITGLLDDLFELSAKIKFVSQISAAIIVIILGGIQVTFINIPFGGELQFGVFSIPITILWIVGVTNAINLIDGLDGLAAGVSSIALITISWMALIMGDIYVLTVGLILIGSTLGFLVFNYHPAKIFMGDTGALFLGYMISVLSLLGFKNVTFISFIVPIIILGVPLSDTFFAIIRRLVNKKPLSSPDKSHLHHCLLQYGLSHRITVLVIYIMSAFFGIVALIFSRSNLWGGFSLIILLILLVEIFAELIGLAGNNYRPVLKLLQSLRVIGKKRYNP
jgi:UDP-GlcNAc:undecaprenyl-phosphate/decaprenyl-phosphate GlcNAc-1-phosphate transferase